MTQFLDKPDLIAADFAGAAADLGLLTTSQFTDQANVAGLVSATSFPSVLQPVLDGKEYRTERYRVVMPDTGDSASLLNDRLEELGTLGGGTLILDSGGAPFVVNSTINAAFSNVSIVSRAGKNTLSFVKGNTFPDGDTLLSCRGDGSSGNTGTSHVSGNELSGFALSGRSPNGTQKAGYLLDTSYTGGFHYRNLAFRRCNNTAWYREEEWDATAYDTRLINCGGPNGSTDAAMRIVSSTADSSNNLRHYGTWWESFQHMALSIEVGTNTGGTGPYGILFSGGKVESIYLVANSTLIQVSEKCRGIIMRDLIVAIGGVNAVGGLVRGIEMNGQASICEGIEFDVRNQDFVSGTQTLARKPTLDWGVKTPTASSLSGGTIRDIYVGPTSSASVNSLIYLTAQNSGGGSQDFQGRLAIENVKGANAAWPMFSGTGYDSAYGVNTIGAKTPQTIGAPGLQQTNTSTTGTPNVTLRKGHATNRQPLPISFASPGTATIPQGLAVAGDVIEITQEGSAAVTLTPFSGVTLDVPTGLSATTPGQGRSVRARCLATNVYRVIG